MATERNFSADFARRLQALREQRGFTQTQLGQRAGMASAAISHFETAQRVPSLESFGKLDGRSWVILRKWTPSF